MIVNPPAAVVFPAYPSAMVPAYPAAVPAYPSAQVPAYKTGVFDGLTLSAWALFIGATGTIVKSSNVSSITRSSAGNYTLNMTAALGNANYLVDVAMSGGNTTKSVLDWGVFSQAAGSFIFSTKLSGAATDIPNVWVSVYA